MAEMLSKQARPVAREVQRSSSCYININHLKPSGYFKYHQA